MILSDKDKYRFIKKFIQSNEDYCWIWNGRKNPQGYGFFDLKNKPILAHRISYFLKYGNIDYNKYVLHRCDNPSCVNPKHLFLGTHKDNMQDMASKKRGNFNNTKYIGEMHSGVKLTNDSVIKIRKEYKRGNAEFLSKKYGVSVSNICLIVSRKTWTHLP